ncbi:MAG: tetratricopeptide repeat protein [Bacteroidales bacterium]|nr:tetratricopeptide repeat protein [Bacteroidales bacterium]MCF8399326.1 tetratricopeptide repeat protein [Bacteroidales bacterium]
MMIKALFNLKGCLSAFFILISLQVFTQETAVYDEPAAGYRTALELFNKEKYAAAQEIFDQIILDINESPSEMKTNAEYYSAICALELTNDNAEYKLTGFIEEHPTSAKIGRAFFQLGRLHFDQRDYRSALRSFQEVNRFDLSRDESTEYNFKTGFCYLNQDDFANAKKRFATVKDGRNPYADQASYYYGHIAYEEGDYLMALEEFEDLKNDRSFSRVIPYYILHIYYYQENYDKILELGPELYQDADYRKKAEIARIIGDAFYRAGDYENALQYLEEYKRAARHSLSREDNYQIAYSYYRTDRFDNAISHFQNVISVEDSLSQNAYYHLADCYIRTDQKKYAANAFLSAYKMDFDQDIKEDALFNYAKLSVEVAHDPYGESIRYLDKYIQDYPDSERLPEAYNLLAQLYLSTKNFKAALTSIEKINNKTTKLKKAYQKIAYYRGIELFNTRQYKEAIELFKTATEYDYDAKITAQANYWMGDAFYRLKNWWGAMKYYKLFLNDRAARVLPEYSKAYYNLGYTYFKRKDYSDAVDNFRDFLETSGNKNPGLMSDAYLRLGDCYFINKRYQTAIEYYNEALRLNKSDQDYAYYQKAMSYGALGKFKEKVSTLNRLVRYHKKSPYYDDALYEIATSHLIMNDNRSALVNFDKLVKESPSSPYARKSLLKSGLIYYNNDQNDNAIKLLKQVAEKYPNTSEAREALASLKNIYIDLNKVNDYFDYSKDLPYAKVSTSEQDSLTYIAAENQYMSGNCDQALPSFEKYIDKFPDGAFLVNVHYYKADCELRQDNQIRALEDLEYVIEQPTSTFTENALLKASRISYQLKMYENAYRHYKALEQAATSNVNINIAIEGMMNSSFYSDNYRQAVDAAQKLLKNDKVSADQSLRAHYILGKSYFALDNYNEAAREFLVVDKLTTNEMGAEAKYYVAYIQFENNELNTAEETIFQLVDEYASQDFWVAKSFILLADIYVKLDNFFQAKQTLQSIIDNYKGEDLKDLAQKRLKQIVEQENAASQNVEQNEGEDF